MLRLARTAYLDIVAHALDCLPEEACGVLSGGPAEGGDGATDADRFYPCRNDAASATLYVLNGLDHLRADRDAEANGRQLVGVVHSHTHTDAYPSPTDVELAVDPEWHYVIVSLADPEPVLRSYRIVAGAITEEPVLLGPR
jgi:proteasome lid subunit RPN8/RPN11